MGRHSRFCFGLSSLCSFFLLFFASVIQAQVQPQITQAIDNTLRVTLKGNVHPLANSASDRGLAANAQPMTRMLLLLKRSDAQQSALQNFMEQQQDKSSPNYHAWLTPQIFGVTYGPADADIQAITGWLTAQGFTVNKVYSGKTIIEFSGNVAQVQQAFGTEIHKYEVNGNVFTANAQDPQIPAALAPVVAGIVSLNSFPRHSHAIMKGVARRVAGKAGLQPLFTFPGNNPNGFFYGVGPGDFATIYNSKALIAGGTNGNGQTIAIVGETNINVSDVTNFRSIFGLPANFTSSNIILNGEDPGITSTDEEGEADLDVQWSGAVAPGATVKFVVSASTPAAAGIDLSALYIIEHNLADVMSESYGACESDLGTGGNAFYNSLWEQAAAQGITVVVSAGDGGSAGCDDFNTENVATKGLAVSGLSGTPFNVSVGGTDFDQINKWSTYWKPESGNDSVTGASALGYIPEIPWNESCAQLGLLGCTTAQGQNFQDIFAGSGGQSTVYPKPFWQLGVAGVPSGSHRYQPDISLFASPGFDLSGYIVCQQDSNIINQNTCDLSLASSFLDFNIIGGTSASAPAFAGVMALVDQYQGATGGSKRQGNANYILYQLAKKSGYSCASSPAEAANCVFNDIVGGNSYFQGSVGTNSVPCAAGKANCSVATGSSLGVLVDPAHTTTEGWTVTPGYDLATGLGTVNIGNLVTNWKNVSTVPTATTLTLSKTTGITHGTNENVTVSGTVKPTVGTSAATGDISLIATINGVTQGFDHFTLKADGSFTGTTQSLPGGTNYQVFAHYAGDGTNAPSDSTPPLSVTVAPENSQTYITVPAENSIGQVTNPNATTVPYGSQFLIRMFVTNTSTAMGANGLPSPLCINQNALTCPTGTVVLTDNGKPVDQGTFSLNGMGYTRDIAPSITVFTGGTHTLKAVYSGDNSYNASSVTDTITVTPAPTITTISSQTLALVGQSMTIYATATANFGNAVAPTGTFTFFDGGNPIPGTVSVQSQGGNPYIQGSLSFTPSAPGSHTLTATYSGDANYATSTTTSPATYVSQYPVTINVSVDNSTVMYGSPVNVTTTVIANHTSPPLAGRLTFSASTTQVPVTSPTTLTTDGNGNQILKASFATTPQGSEGIQAYYTQDPNYADNQNGVFVTVNIPDFTITANPTVTATAGQTGTGSFQIAPLSNNPSPVTLTTYGTVPAGATLSFSPSPVNLNGTTVPVTIQLTTTGTNGVQSNALKTQIKHAGLLGYSKTGWWSISLAFLIFCVYLVGIPGRRKRFRAAFLLLVLSMLSFSLGCGGGGGSGGGGGGGGGGITLVPSTTTLTVDNPKLGPGMSATLTASVTSSGSPTGNVTFYQGSNQISGSVNLVNGKATLPVSFLAAYFGTYQYTAQYSGDNANLPSTSSAINEVYTGSSQLTLLATTGSLQHQTTLTITLQ